MITRTDPPRYYAVTLVNKGPRCPLMIWYGPPLDPLTSEVLDRSPRWNVKLNGDFVDGAHFAMLVGDVAYVKGEPIDRDEYDHLLSVRNWALEHSPESPEAAPREAINLNKLRTIF